LTKKKLIFLLTLTALIGCSDKTTYKSANAVVIDTKHRHWGKGYYELEVYYQYFNGSDTVTGHSTAEGKERSYTAKYIPGDSLKIGFNPNDSTDTFISEKIYAKPRQKK
jgi:hypothetical protein